MSSPHHAHAARAPRRRRIRLGAVVGCAAVGCALLASTLAAPSQPAAAGVTSHSTTITSTCSTKMGPSGALPATKLSGYTLAYCTQFTGTKLPKGWSKFAGVPGGDPTGLFVRSHVKVKDGELRLLTYRDVHKHDIWATGGSCLCALGETYGAFFVRSRVTGPGVNEIDLLWPVAKVWPPEIDFNESGASTAGTGWTVHYDANNQFVQAVTTVNLTKWHTWGVIWTPTSISFTLDGQPWGTVTNSAAIPNQAMTLDISQQTWCGQNNMCPTSPQTMDVDWVEIFTPDKS